MNEISEFPCSTWMPEGGLLRRSRKKLEALNGVGVLGPLAREHACEGAPCHPVERRQADDPALVGVDRDVASPAK
eukprot:5668481-Alexandrium_andersonii.AAC.1